MKTIDQPTRRDVEVNIGVETVHILKTLMLLDRPCGARTITRILKGEDREDFLQAKHRSVETFGELAHLNSLGIENLVYCLLNLGYIQVADQAYGTLEITDLGRDFVEQGGELVVMEENIRLRWYQFELSRRLEVVRRKLANDLGQAPYEVFNNVAMRQIVERMPGTEALLLTVTGMRNLPAESRAEILKEIKEMLSRKALDEKTGIFRRAFRPAAREVRKMLESGNTLSEIAAARNVKPQTVCAYVESIHRTGLLNLRPWIEANVDGATLHKGTEYFRQARVPRLREAHEILGIDYDTLSLCRLYVDKVEEPAPAYV
jgi:hypothetical protein